MLIGLGIYFLFQQFNIPFLNKFYSWPTILMIIGGALIFNGFSKKDDESLFSGAIVLGLGIHFHGLNNYPNWINHWAVYIFIVGVAILVRFIQTRKQFLTGIGLIAISLLFMLPINISNMDWLNKSEYIWPVALIFVGIYLLRRK